jgi:TPP-dependent indolepyruvate ferredoxin oxidoreductase alpha subunit
VKLAEAVGMTRDNVRVVDAYKPKDIEEAINSLVQTDSLSLLVVQGLCVILRKRRQRGA